MTTSYPSNLPAPAFEGFGASVAMGVARADGPTDQAQRRIHATMPHTFMLTFVMSISDWASWYSWVQANGYRWFQLSLPTLYAGRTEDWLSPVLVRFISDLSATQFSADSAKVTVTAESAPSMIGSYLAAT